MPLNSRALSITDYLPRLLLIALILINFIYFGSYATQRHLAFETGAFDTGVYVQPLWNFINGLGFSVSIIEDNGPLRWATHIEPILYLIAPIYALWPVPQTLFWLQAAALSLAALPMYGLGVRRLKNEWVALAVVLAYFLMPATQSVTLFDFHAVSLAPLFLLSAIYFLDRALDARGVSFWLWPEARTEAAPLNQLDQQDGQTLHRLIKTFSAPAARTLYILSGLSFLLALSTKEDISLHVFMIGLYLLILRRRWWEGATLAIVGLAWFYVTFQLIIPAFRTGGGHSIYAAWFETLGSTPLEIALSPITTPDKVLALIFRPGTIPALAMITVPMALLPLAGLPVFMLTAPSVAFSLLSQNPTLRQLESWHYAAPMLAFIVLGTIDGLARISHYLARTANKKRLGGLKMPWRNAYKPQKNPQANFYLAAPEPAAPVIMAALAILLLITAFVYQNLRGYTILSQLYEWPRTTAHHQLGREIAATIPPEASVLAQAQLIPYVAHRQELGIWSGPLITDFDYIWLDLSHRKLPNRFNAHGDLLIGLIIEHDFGIVTHVDGYMLLKNGARRDIIGEELFTFTEFDQIPAEAQPFDATFGGELRLIAVEPEIRRLATSETEPQVILYFDVLRTPAEDYHLFLYLLGPDGAIVGATDFPQPALFWWPTARWQQGDQRQVRVNTIPWWSGDKATFAYAIGLSRSDDPWDVSARLPVMIADPGSNPPGSAPIDSDTLLPIAAFRRFAGLPYPKPLTILSGAESQP